MRGMGYLPFMYLPSSEEHSQLPAVLCVCSYIQLLNFAYTGSMITSLLLSLKLTAVA